MPSEITPADRDMMIRTVMGEVDPGDPDMGRAGVAYSILNRLARGGYGNTASQVILSRGQYEPWMTRRRELQGYSQNSPEYRHAADIVDGVISGAIPDPTNGATHFVAPSIMATRGGMPSWTQGHKPSAVIGGHQFYNDIAGGSGAKGEDPFAGIGSPSTTAAPAASAGADWEDPFAGIPATSKEAPAAPAVAAQAVSNAPVEVPLSTEQGPMAKPVVPDSLQQSPQPQNWSDWLADRLHSIRVATDPVHVGTEAAKALGTATAEKFSAARALAGQGATDILANRPATGFGEVASGLLGIASSPVSGAIHAGVGQPVAGVFGPEAGERAEALAGLSVPMPAGAKVAASVRPAYQATNTLVDAIGAENVPEAVARLRANPRLRVMDVSEPVRVMAQGLAADPAQAAAARALRGAVQESRATLPAATNEAYTAAMGPAPDTVAMVEGLKDRAREAGRTAIQPALAGAKPVDVSPVVSAIDAEVRPGLQALLNPSTRLPLSPRQEELLRLRNQLVNPETGETLTDAGRLHEVQSRNGDRAFQFQSSPDGWSRDVGNGLRGVNEKLVDAIDVASGGAYRPARARFKDAMDIQQAFEEGFDVLKNRQGVSGLEDRPEALRNWMANASPEEVVAKRLGTRSDIDQKIRGVRNQALAGQNITGIEYNREKLATLFGDQESDRLIRAMEDAQLEAHTNAKMVEGAKTAETLLGRAALNVRPPRPMKISPVGATALLGPVAGEIASHLSGLALYPGAGAAAGAGMLLAGAGVGGALKGGTAVARQLERARNLSFARQASATGEAREAVINALASHPDVIRALNKPTNPLLPP